MIKETQANDKNELRKRKTIFVLLIILFILCIIISIVIEIVESKKTIEPVNIKQTKAEKKQIIEFDHLFEENQEKPIIDSKYKNNDSKDVVYTVYENKEKKENEYNIQVSIPEINIKSDKIDKINKEIIDVFKTKAENIIKTINREEVIYTVEYAQSINSDILSVVIKSTLKEGNNAQRVIVKGYTYNFITNEVLDFKDLILIKQINEKDITKEIKKVIKENIDKSQTLINLGYNVFERNLDDKIYEIENIDNFFYGPNEVLYIIFAYGNNRYTSELDIVEIN